MTEPRNQMDPNWSPDGSSVIFSYFPLFDRMPPEKLGVYMVDLRTRSLKKLPGSDGLWVPRWSSDGSHIVARSADSQSLMLFDFVTRTWSELVRDVYVIASRQDMEAATSRPRPLRGSTASWRPRFAMTLPPCLFLPPVEHRPGREL